MFADVMFIAILVAFYGVCVGFVRICDRVIGAEDAVVTDIADLDDVDGQVAA